MCRHRAVFVNSGGILVGMELAFVNEIPEPVSEKYALISNNRIER